jgi:hypothetical protein
MKNDRHLQLINSAVYEKESQARTKAIEQTRQKKQALQNEREQLKLLHFLNRVENNDGPGPGPNRQHAADRYEIVVQGIQFHVTKNGSKLVKLTGVSMWPMFGARATFLQLSRRL